MILLALLAVTASAQYGTPVSVNYADVYDYSHSGWEDYGSAIVLGGPLMTLKITCEWNDQGWGNQKGHMRVALMRGGVMIADENLFGVAPHSRTAVSYIRSKNAYPIMNQTMAGDSLQLQYHVGGGGGHRLSVYGLVLTYTEMPQLAPGQTLPPSPAPTPAPTMDLCHPALEDWGCCGGWANYLCAEHQGDCDYDGDCMPGLVCAHDIGGAYGADALFDVCMKAGYTLPPTNSPTAPDCRAMLNVQGCCGNNWPYRCKEGEGECTDDSECERGLFCTADAGAIFGGSPSLDVCTTITRPPTAAPTGAVCTPSNQDWSCCSRSNQCASGGGDCDSDSDCEGRLKCIDDVGRNYGASSSFDICLAPGEMCEPRFNDNNCCGDRISNMGRRRLGHGSYWGGYGYGSGYYGGYYGGSYYGGYYGGYGSGYGYGSYYGGKTYECHEGEGGCNSDSDCATGLECQTGKARRYGSSLSYMGICLIPAGQNGRCDPALEEWGCCTKDYPCGDGEGDCDSDAECADDTTCGHNVGGKYGVTTSFDVCQGAPTMAPTTAPTITPTSAPTMSPTVDCLAYSKKDCKKDATAKLYCKKTKGKCFFRNVVDCTMYNLLGSKGKKVCDKDKNLNCAWDKNTNTCSPFSCALYSGRNDKNCAPLSPQCLYDSATKTCNDNTDCSVATSKRDCSTMVSLGLNANCVWQNSLCEDVAPPTPNPTPMPVVPTIVCTTVNVGNSTPYSGAPPKVVDVPGLQKWQTCPTYVDKNVWLTSDTYDDEFTVKQRGTKVTVTRINAIHTGWGMNLMFDCCGPQPQAPPPTKATPAPVQAAGCSANTDKSSCKAAGCKWKSTVCK